MSCANDASAYNLYRLKIDTCDEELTQISTALHSTELSLLPVRCYLSPNTSLIDYALLATIVLAVENENERCR